MDIFIFGIGLCTGFYLRKTTFGTVLANRIFALYKIQTKKLLNEEYKLALIVRDDLKMGRGKVAAQCSHASILAFQNSLEEQPDATRFWEAFGQTKIVLKAGNEEAILKLHDTARALNLPTSIVRDAGRTQVAWGSKTVLAIGPSPVSLLNKVTAHLKLL